MGETVAMDTGRGRLWLDKGGRERTVAVVVVVAVVPELVVEERDDGRTEVVGVRAAPDDLARAWRALEAAEADDDDDAVSVPGIREEVVAVAPEMPRRDDGTLEEVDGLVLSAAPTEEAVPDVVGARVEEEEEDGMRAEGVRVGR
jgi:hypothetical protein